MRRVFLVDGSALMFRSFHAFAKSAMLTSNGQDVGMTYGFLLSLLMVIRNEKPDRMAITFDTAAPTFRKEMYEEYKANRPPMDENMEAQLPLLHEVVDLLNIPRLFKEGWEADDIMGTLARQGAEAGDEVFLVTGDKDFYQLVNDNIKVYTLPTRAQRTAVVYDRDGVKNKFGVYPEQVIDALALIGDTSDNVPGVPKVGQKTAAKLLDEFGDLETLLNSAEKVKQKAVKANLIEGKEQALLSRKLVTIDQNTPLEVSISDLDYGPLNNPELRKKMTELEFSSILKQLDELEPREEAEQEKKQTDSDSLDYKTVTTQDQLRDMIDQLRKADLVSFDTETTSLNPLQAKLVGLSFSIAEKQAWYITVNHFEKMPEAYEPPPAPKLRPDPAPELSFIVNRLKPFFSNPDIKKTGQNLKYDIHVLNCYDCPVEGVVFDTMIASHILDPSARQNNLDFLAEKHLGITKVPTSHLIGSGAKQLSMLDVDLEKISYYACEDADAALRLSHLFKEDIDKHGFNHLIDELEIPLMKVLLKMEGYGIKIDQDLLAEMSARYGEEIETLEGNVYKLAGTGFNLNSTQQLADVLYNVLGLPPGRKTKFGYSTDIRELERLAPLHELPAKLLRYRHLTKLRSTYIDALPRLVHPITGRVHTSYSQTVAATGRLSSNDPNLQNIPIRSEEGGAIRRAFIGGEPGWKIMAADYSQVELRIMAHLSGDEYMIKAFSEGLDIHRATAAWMYDSPPELVTSDMRRSAKEVNFGVLYGMGGFGLAQRLNITRKRANEFIEQYFSRFSRVKEYIEEIKASTKESGYVETILGRKRPLPDINSKNYQVRQNAERIAINTPIQGSAADIIKIAMIKVQNMLENERFKARMLLQVHDELVFEAPEEELESLSAKVSKEMSAAMDLKVPLEVDANWGDNWLDAH